MTRFIVVDFISEDQTSEKLPCHFPFEYKGEMQDMCIKAGSVNYWCATAPKYSEHTWRDCTKGASVHFTNKYCDLENQTEKISLPISNRPQIIVWGLGANDGMTSVHSGCRVIFTEDRVPDNMPCHFPFTNKGEEYTTCIADGTARHWCAVTPEYTDISWRYCKDGMSFLFSVVVITRLAESRGKSTNRKTTWQPCLKRAL